VADVADRWRTQLLKVLAWLSVVLMNSKRENKDFMVVDEGKVAGEDDDRDDHERWLMMVFDGIKDEDGR